MNIDSLKQALTDSLQIEMQKNGDIYKAILTEQHETYELIVYIWIAITAILISGTLFWNFYLANKKIATSIDEKTAKLNANLEKLIKINITELKNSQDDFESRINLQIQKNKEESKNILNKLIEESKTEAENRFVKLEAESHRAFANSAMEGQSYWTAVIRYFAAMVSYSETNQSEMVCRCLNAMLLCLKQDNCKQQFDPNDNLYDPMIKKIGTLPGYVEDKRDEVISLLKALKE